MIHIAFSIRKYFIYRLPNAFPVKMFEPHIEKPVSISLIEMEWFKYITWNSFAVDLSFRLPRSADSNGKKIRQRENMGPTIKWIEIVKIEDTGKCF